MLMMRRHLEKVLGPIGETEIEERLARANLLYARYWYETFRLPAMSPEDVLSRLETRNEEVIAEAVKSGRGLVIALPHLGNWDFAGCYVSLKYKPVLAVAEYLKPPAAFAHWKKIRERLGMRIVALDGTTEPAKQAMRYLRSGGIVGLVADRWLGGASIPVEFFGEKTLVPAGPATLARRTDALLVPVGLYIRDDGTHLGIVDTPVACPRTSDAKRDIAEATQRLVERFEHLIRLDPEQWHVYTPFWPSDWEALGLEAPFKVRD
jgi:KDO2-lipid IV(A) lauroyltransferase